MSDPYIGEIRMFGGNFAPRGWGFCNGQLLPIAAYEALFNLIGTTYGGDGVTTFAVPNLQGRIPIHQSSSYPIGSAAGSETVTLTTNQLPSHSHQLLGSSAEVETSSPSGGVFATSADTSLYAPFNADKAAALSPSVMTPAGGSQPHDNMQPYLCVTFIVALEGIYPQQG